MTKLQARVFFPLLILLLIKREEAGERLLCVADLCCNPAELEGCVNWPVSSPPPLPMNGGEMTE